MRLLLQKECTGLGGLQIIMVFLLPMLALVKDSLEVLYTEDVSEFKADRYDLRNS